VFPSSQVVPQVKQKIVAVVDSIVSNPGVLLPCQEMVQICKEDAAHIIGQEVVINLSKAQLDFWVSVRVHFVNLVFSTAPLCRTVINGFTPNGAAVLDVPKRN